MEDSSQRPVSKQTKERTQLDGCLDSILKLSQAFGIVFIPLVIAYFGMRLEKSSSDAVIGQQYVALAIDILREEKNSDERSEHLRTWAVNTLNTHAEVKLEGEARERLVKGTERFPKRENWEDSIGWGDSYDVYKYDID